METKPHPLKHFLLELLCRLHSAQNTTGRQIHFTVIHLQIKNTITRGYYVLLGCCLVTGISKKIKNLQSLAGLALIQQTRRHIPRAMYQFILNMSYLGEGSYFLYIYHADLACYIARFCIFSIIIPSITVSEKEKTHQPISSPQKYDSRKRLFEGGE